jgi:hypothetical protein
MYDFFGICNAIKAAVSIYRETTRRTGRTTFLMQNVTTEDRVVFLSEQDRRFFINKAKDEYKKDGLNTIVISPSDLNLLFRDGTPRGRTIFDHRFVEEFMSLRISQACDEIKHLQEQTSGHGEAHVNTRNSYLKHNKRSDLY